MQRGHVVIGAVWSDRPMCAFGDVSCLMQRTPNAAPAWLLTLSLPKPADLALSRTLQCRAVVDDFGDLVPVTAWR